MDGPDTYLAHASKTSPASMAIKIQDPTVLRPDFYHTTKAGSERQRLALACQICRQKKVKCDGELPRCGRCSNLDLECEYKLTTHRRSRNPGKQKADGSQGDRPSNGKDGTPEYSAPNAKRQRNESLPASRATAQVSQFQQIPRPISLQPPMNDKPMMDDARLGQLPQWPDPSVNERLGRFPTIRYRHELPDVLPNHKLLVELCQVYLSHCYSQVYAFLHPSIFLRAVVERPQSLPTALLLAISALAARFHANATPGSLKPNLWASSCLDIIFGMTTNGKHDDEASLLASLGQKFNRPFLSEPSLSSVQALNVVSYHYFGEGQSSTAWLLSGFAIRMAHSLHLNTEFYDDPIGLPQNQPPGHHVSFTEREVRRRTYWSLYIMDRLNSAGERRPFTIRNEDVDIQLPVSQTAFDREVPSITASLLGPVLRGTFHNDPVENMDSFAWLIRIVDLWGEVTCHVQTPAVFGTTPEDCPLYLLRRKAALWLESLPIGLRYENGPPETNPARWYTMFMVYHLSLCIMHRFALPRSPTNQRYAIDHIPPHYIDMCVAEAVHNARQVSEIIQSLPAHVTLTAPFTGFAAFSAATLHAFFGFHVPDHDPVLVAQHRSYVHSTLTFLDDLGKAWKPLAKMYDALSSQISLQPRSSRSNRSSILHDTQGLANGSRFVVPESMPVQFSVDQQIQLNTLAFSNWFENPMTQSFFGPNTPSSTLTTQSHGHNNGYHPAPISYPSQPQSQGQYEARQDRLGTLQQQSQQQNGFVARPSSHPSFGDSYGGLVGGRDASEGRSEEVDHDRDDENDDTLAADLLVSFQQSEYLGGTSRSPVHYKDRAASTSGGGGGGASGTHFANGERNASSEARRREEYLDRLGNLKPTTPFDATAAIDILQFMKVGVITAAHWS